MSGILLTAHFGVKRVQAMKTRFNVKDLRESGLEIVGPLDPSFDNRVSEYFEGKSVNDLQDMKPFTIFLNNHGKTHLIAYVLKWELTRRDGIGTTSYKADGQPGILMGYSVNPHAPPGQTHVISPGKSRLFSIMSPIDPGEEKMMGGGTFATNEKQINLSSRSYERIRSELPLLANITVSLDAAFFADGTFVGPNSSHYFESIKAEIDAKRDMLAMLANAARSKEDLAQAWQSIQSISDTVPPALRLDSTPDEIYKYHSQTFARYILAIRDQYGQEKATQHVKDFHNSRKPELKKAQERL
jgi:hypothetical protein